MNEVALRTPRLSPADGWEHGRTLVLRWLTIAVALTTIVLGTLLLVDLPPGTANYTPVVFVAAGMSVLLGSLAIQRDSRAPMPLAPSGTVDRFHDPRGPARVLVGPSTASDELGSKLPGVGSEWRVLSAPATPGDETWLSWLPRERRRLGPEAGPPSTGVVRSPGQAGNLVAFPVRNYYAAAPPGPGARPPRSAQTPPERASTSDLRGDAHSAYHPSSTGVAAENWRTGVPFHRPFSVEELDRMFPPLAGAQRMFLNDAPLRIGRGETSDPSGSFGTLSLDSEGTASRSPPHRSRRGEAGDLEDRADRYDPRVGWSESRAAKLRDESPIADARRNDLSLEAANPVPPHLRAQGVVERSSSSPGSRSGPVAPGARSVCASCSTVVLNLRMSGPCPRCLRPICAECLSEALRSRGRGWCTDCLSHAEAAG